MFVLILVFLILLLLLIFVVVFGIIVGNIFFVFVFDVGLRIIIPVGGGPTVTLVDLCGLFKIALAACPGSRRG